MTASCKAGIFWLLLLASSGFLRANEEKHHSRARLKVAFVIDAIDTAKSGGIMTAQRFVKELREEVDLRLITTGEPGEDKNRVKLRGFYIPFFKDLMKRNGMKFAYPDKEVIKKAIADVDLVYIHLPFYLGYKTIEWARKLGKPVVAAFHIQPENLLDNAGVSAPFLINSIYRSNIRRVYNAADYVICPSVFSEDILKSFPSFKTPTVVISNGLTRDFRPNRQEKSADHAEKFVILTVGRLSREKNHETIIAAIAGSKYKDRIQLVATGDGALKEQLIASAKRQGVTASFGFVSHDELIRLYNSSDLYIGASEVELEGMSILEAIGTGLPALISDAKESAAKQFALDSEFLFTNRDAKDLSQKIDHWFEHQEELKEKGKLYAESAKKYYIETSVAKMLATFEAAVQNHKQ